MVQGTLTALPPTPVYNIRLLNKTCKVFLETRLRGISKDLLPGLLISDGLAFLGFGADSSRRKIEVPRYNVRNSKSENMRRSGENGPNIRTNAMQQMQVPNGTGYGVRKSKRPLLASRTRCNVVWKPPENGNKGKIGNTVQFGN